MPHTLDGSAGSNKPLDEMAARPEDRTITSHHGEAVMEKGPVDFEAHIQEHRGELSTEKAAQLVDTAERKHMEDALIESAELLKATLESTADGILAVNEKGEVLIANTRFREMWRIPDDLMATKDDSRLLDHVLGQLREPEAFLEKVQELYSSPGEDFDTILFKDGRIFERFSCPLIQKGSVAGRVWSFRDVTTRREAAEALRESEEKYRLLAENVSDVIWTMDLNLRFTYLSPSVEMLYGWTADEFQALTPSGYLSPDSLELILKVLADELALQGSPEADPNRVRTLELRQYRKDGTTFWSEVSARFLFDDMGVANGVIGTTRDISERRRADEALRVSEEKFSKAFRSSPITLSISRLSDGRIIDINDSASVMFGFGRDEVIGRTSLDLDIWVDARDRQELTAELAAKGFLRDKEYRFRRKDRTIITVYFGAEIIELERERCMLATMVDITERKRVEKALLESQERFQELAELLPETIFEMDADGVLTFVNQNAFAHFGFSQEDFDGGLNGFEMISPEDRPRAAENVRRVLSGEKLGLNEYTGIRKDGSTFPVIMHSAPKYREGEPVGIRGIVIDVTETKKLEAQLRQAHKMEAVGTLAGGIAHDFNNLLQAVQGYAELLLMRKTETEPGYQELMEISRAAKRGGELTRQLLTFSRKVESKLQPTDLNRIVEDVRLLLERTIPKMIKIELQLTTNLDYVNADASQIEQILMNLAVNARDAMPDGGMLTIATSNVILDEKDHYQQAEVTPGNYVLLRVADTGEGMDKSTLEHIFDPFFTTKEVGKGTGLGLAMVYGIVKSHGGHIACHSTLGEGTVFEVVLPAVETAEKLSTTLTGSDEPRGGHETVLLVEDDQSLRELGEQILKMFGYAVISAADGERALQIYREDKAAIDLVILDLIMPGMGGEQCLQEILAINSQAKVIIASGYSAGAETEWAAAIGAKALVEKPYNVQQMLKVVREVLG